MPVYLWKQQVRRLGSDLVLELFKLLSTKVEVEDDLEEITIPSHSTAITHDCDFCCARVASAAKLKVS